MKILSATGYFLAIAGFLGAIALHPLQAVELSDGTIHFVRPPSLLDSTTTTNTVLARSTYYFTIAVPETAGEPLERIQVDQQNGENFTRRVEFETDESEAFIGTFRDRGTEIPIRETQYDPETQSVAVVFAEPVPPGTVVTIALRPERNPRQDGVYLFGVTAFPPGERGQGQFLGYGRFHFYRSDSPFLFR